MKTPRIVNAVSHIDDDLVSSATHTVATKKPSLLKWGSLVASLMLVLMAVIVFLPAEPINNEAVYVEGYFYGIDEGDFSSYIGGKVISQDKLGAKISDVSLTAGWKNAAGEWSSTTEKLRGEVYAIQGVSNDVAVALKFIDQGEAVTTTHYYVIMNPSADLTPVKDYVITQYTPNSPGHMGEINSDEVLEAKLEKHYDFVIKSDAFATYINGKVIATEKIGAKFETVAVTGGWKNEAGEWLSTEVLTAEVYEITGIDSSVAVALKFIDQGESVTTTHYYVMMNPSADLSIVQEYIREPLTQNNADYEGSAEEGTIKNYYTSEATKEHSPL